MRWWQVLFLAVALAGGFVVTSSCSVTRDGEMVHRVERYPERDPIRPARPLDEEKSWADRVGEVGVVILGVALIAGSIALPFLLL